VAGKKDINLESGLVLHAWANDLFGILFDYSYRHFYEDGYGKDFRILNLKNQTAEYTDLLLLGNLLSFHEQRRYFRENREELKYYGLQPPLWVFVGSSVTKKEQSDIGTVSRFLHRFLKNEGGWSVETIDRLLKGETGLLDGDDRDAFAGRFGYLKDSSSAREVYENVLSEVFHAGAGGGLHVADIKGAEGELGLKVSGTERYFGLIYIGDTSAFKKLLEAEAPEIVVEEDVIGGGCSGRSTTPTRRSTSSSGRRNSSRAGIAGGYPPWACSISARARGPRSSSSSGVVCA
jgi:hypothetical protein